MFQLGRSQVAGFIENIGGNEQTTRTTRGLGKTHVKNAYASIPYTVNCTSNIAKH